MFVRCKKRFKDGKEHRYWSVVENVRVRGGRVVQRQVLYLGEINHSQRAAWCRSIEVVEGKSGSRQMALFPGDREAPALDCEVVKIDVSEVSLHDPRQWGACWLALVLWDRLELDRFWGPRLPPSRQGTRWLDILKILACYRLIDPGSEWRLHRHWYEHSALRDLLGYDRAIADDTLYRYVAVRDAALVEWAGSIRAIPLKKTVRPRIVWLSAENMDAMIAGPDRRTVAGRVEYALLLFLYNTGARASEAAGLRVEDLHLPERTGENARATIHGKGGKIRVTPMWTSTAEALAVLSRDRPPGCGSVFWSRHRKPYTRHGIIELVERAAARVPELVGRKITPHVLRHSCACHLLRSGVDINTIRAWLGHVSLATTNVYAEVDLRAKEEAMKSTCPGDAGDGPRWKASVGLLEQLKAI